MQLSEFGISSMDYAIAQKKILEYQRNLQYAYYYADFGSK
ncbi:hypothetical protein NIES19_39230 [Anabaena cylindrica PCC 7122]|nr:hypothetical protein NIES19_39230 [Anabaena cylindrica PCC 7122]